LSISLVPGALPESYMNLEVFVQTLVEQEGSGCIEIEPSSVKTDHMRIREHVTH